MILVLLSVVSAIICVLIFAVRYHFQQFRRQGIVGPRPEFPFGNTKSAILRKRNIIYDVDDIYRNFKDKSPFSGFFTMFTPYLLANDPELIKQMFIKDFKKFKNNDFTVNHSKDPIIARNPFWLKDSAWKEKRNEVIPAMTAVKLKAMYPLILDGTKNMVDYINSEIGLDKSKAFDARDICARYTCDSITSCTFGADAKSFTSDNPFFYQKGRQMLRGMVDSLQSFFPKKMLPAEVEQFFIEIAKDAIKFRTENKIQQEDFLSHTIMIKEKKGMDDLDAAAHCVTLFLDGYETTSVTLHHALYELGRNQRIQDKLRAEINENVIGLDILGYDKLLELPYLNQIFYENLRLHPPLLLTTRVCSEDVEVKDYKGHKLIMKKNSSIWIPIPSIQRDPQYYPDPESFNPERFNPEYGGVKAFKDRCVLIPFGDGPRICSGMRFAYMQVKAAIVEVIRNFEISIDEATPEDLKISPTEFMNVMDHKLMLKFKSIKQIKLH